MTEASAEPGCALLLASGERGRALAYADGVLHMVCERAHPPGQPLSLTLHLPDATQLALQGKCAGSKLRDSGEFDVKLRLTSLRREQRALLEQLLAASATSERSEPRGV
jgi:hypothetical protein